MIILNEYDIGTAFKAIEDELIASMIRNMDRHRAEETKEGLQWSMWQAKQLKALEKYKRQNRKRYKKQFKSINGQIGTLIQRARVEGNMAQETQILKAIQRGYRFPNMPESVLNLLEEMDGKTFRQKASLLLRYLGTGKHSERAAEFFRLNDRKLDALMKATTQDMERAETAILRMADDQYRKAIFNAQVYANSGAGTYKQAVDMATKDMLSRGLNCVEYANGARHTLADYADMAVRTASKRAYLQGEGEKRQEWGIATVIVNKRGNPCPKCLPFVGKVLIDDVWSGGKKSDGPYPLMSTAIAAGLYHPRCKDGHTTYFPGISTADDTWTKEELEAIGQANQLEAERQYAERQVERFGRLAAYSLDAGNQKQYQNKEGQWKQVVKDTESDIIKSEITKEVADVHQVGKIDKGIYKCITEDIITDEVIITDAQIRHIMERHPDAYEKTVDSLKDALANPDYIIKDKHRNTGLVIKRLETENGNLQIVLRVCTSEDERGYKNSIISCWEISDKRLKNYLRNKTILYKKE